MKKTISFILTFIMLLSAAGCSPKTGLDPNDPVTLTIWHVYGSQTESPFNDSIDVFNNTVGKEKGIVINVTSVHSTSSIDAALEAAANEEPGVPELPDLFVAYPRVAEIVGTDKLLDFSDYFSKAELDGFKDEFLTEGYFGEKLLMVPIAKSTEMFFLNKTLFDASGVDAVQADLSTFEGLFRTCEQYYDQTNGKDMFQINDFYHYVLTGMAAYNENFIEDGKISISGDAFEKVWTPMAHAGIYGGLCLGDGYASDRWKTGEVIANIGSTAGILYLRDYVTYPDNTTLDIETAVTAYPHFQDKVSFVVHRGGGLFALKSENAAKNEAAAIFAKWITEKENNIDFSTKTGYLPVTEAAFETLFADTSVVENAKYKLLYDGVKEMAENCTYVTPPLYEGASEVQSGFEDNVKRILNHAHTEYLQRTGAGEDKEVVMDDLLSSSLAKIRALYA